MTDTTGKLVAAMSPRVDPLIPGKVPPEETLVGRFRRMAAAHPHRTAVVDTEGSMTYADLDAASNRIAAVITSHGARPGERVLLLLKEGTPIILGWLGVLKTGAICVPLALSHPAARLTAVAAQCSPGLILSQRPHLALAATLAAGVCAVVDLDDETTESSGGPVPDLADVTADDCAYILFTSGTTGRPKGVMQTHSNALHNVRHMSALCSVTSVDHLAVLTTFTMGQGIAGLFMSLMNGATLHPYPLPQAGLAPLAGWMRDRRITMYISSVSIFRQFAESHPGPVDLPDLRVVRLGTEELRAGDVALFQQRFPRGTKLFNCLGSSETLNYAAAVFDHDTMLHDGVVPVGTPPEGTILVVNNGGQDGGPGEILVCSRHLSPGYWNEPTLTARRFTQDAQGRRCYRTGDLGRWLPDGRLTFVGRADRQVKIRGNRVELNDIEATLRNHPDIAEAVVSVREGLHPELVAHVQTRLTEGAVRQHLQDHLPAFMVPAVIARLDRMPLTPSGKVDRQQLQLQAAVPDQSASPPCSPRDETEAALARCWAKVLTHDRFGVHDDFLAVGGDSLLALTLFAEIQREMKVSFTARDVVGAFTLAEMATRAGQKATAASAADLGFLVPVRIGVSGVPIVVIPGGWGGDNEILVCARVALGVHPDHPVYAVRSRAMDPSWTLSSTLDEHAAAIFHALEGVTRAGNWVLIGECVAASATLAVLHHAVATGCPPARVVLLDPLAPRQEAWPTRLLRNWRLPFQRRGGLESPLPETASLPPPIAAYYRLLKESRPAPTGVDLHLVVTSDRTGLRRLVRYWKQFTQGQVHLHRVGGSHDSYIREDLADTVRVLRGILPSESRDGVVT